MFVSFFWDFSEENMEEKMSRGNYFEVIDDHGIKKFRRDLELGLDLSSSKAKLDTRAQFGKVTWKHKISNVQLDITPLDIWDIPPSVFLLGLRNSTSVAFDTWVPVDISYQKFFEELPDFIWGVQVSSYKDGITSVKINFDCLSSGRRGLFPTKLTNEYIDLESLNSTGVITNTKKWAYALSREDAFWVINDYDKYNNIIPGRTEMWPTLEGIVEDCRSFWTGLKERLDGLDYFSMKKMIEFET